MRGGQRGGGGGRGGAGQRALPRSCLPGRQPELPERAARFPKVRHPTARSPGASHASLEEPITLVPVNWPWAICGLCGFPSASISVLHSSLSLSVLIFPRCSPFFTGILLLWHLQRSSFYPLALSNSERELGCLNLGSFSFLLLSLQLGDQQVEASPGSLLEMQHLRSSPTPPGSEATFQREV